MDEKEIRAVFIKHSMEKNPELELFDTDAIIKDLAALIASYSREARKHGYNAGWSGRDRTKPKRYICEICKTITGEALKEAKPVEGSNK